LSATEHLSDRLDVFRNDRRLFPFIEKICREISLADGIYRCLRVKIDIDLLFTYRYPAISTLKRDRLTFYVTLHASGVQINFLLPIDAFINLPSTGKFSPAGQ